MLVKIEDIKVKLRVRKEKGDIESLKRSLNKFGLLNPITLNSKYELIAGERRLLAAKELGWTTINAVILENLSEIQELELELEENSQRKAFTDNELIEGYDRLEKMKNPSFFEKIMKAIKNFFKWLTGLFKRK